MKRIASEVKVPEEYIRTSSRLNSVPVCAHIHLCICKCLQVWVYTCVCVHVHVYAYACLHTHKSICASVPLCICIYACVQAHAFMYVCMCAIQLFPWLWPFLSEEGRTHVCQFQSFVHTAARHGDLHLVHGPLSSWHLRVDFSEMEKRRATVSPSHYPCIHRLANILV